MAAKGEAEHKQAIASSSKTLSATITLNDGRQMYSCGLGTYRAKPADAYNAVLTALRLGYRHIDTAAVYGNEADVGRAIRDSGLPREELWVTTKLHPRKLGYDRAIAECEQSLKQLGLDYVDLYLIHAPLDKENRLDAWRAFEDLQTAGKAKSIGVSNYGVHHLKELLAVCRVVPAVNQIELSPFLTHKDIVSACSEAGIAVEAYSSLTKGKMLQSPALVAIANAHENTTTAQVLLKWALQRGYIIIPKSTREERVAENSCLDGLTLTQQEMDTLNALDCYFTTGWDPTRSP